MSLFTDYFWPSPISRTLQALSISWMDILQCSSAGKKRLKSHVQQLGTQFEQFLLTGFCAIIWCNHLVQRVLHHVPGLAQQRLDSCELLPTSCGPSHKRLQKQRGDMAWLWQTKLDCNCDTWFQSKWLNILTGKKGWKAWQNDWVVTVTMTVAWKWCNRVSECWHLAHCHCHKQLKTSSFSNVRLWDCETVRLWDCKTVRLWDCDTFMNHPDGLELEYWIRLNWII